VLSLLGFDRALRFHAAILTQNSYTGNWDEPGLGPFFSFNNFLLTKDSQTRL